MADALSLLNRVRYAGLDFNTHSDEILARIQVKFAADFNDFSASSLGIMLVDLVSFGLDTLSFYLDRRATDTFLETARSRRSVARLTRQLGYKMRAAIASSVTVTHTILDPFSVPVTLAKGYQFKGPNDLIFEVAQDVTHAPGERTKDIPCYEGQTYSETFTSDGSANQVFELRRVRDGRYLVGGSVVVTVAGSDWKEEEFLTFDQTNQYEVGYNDDPPTIRFGDGIAGNIPTTGASIVVKYVVSRGREGQVARNTIKSAVAPLVVSFTTLRTQITNAAGSVGGDNPETIDEAKRNAPRVFKTRNVAVTREDYESLGNAYADPLAGRVAVAQAIASRSAQDDLELVNQIASIRTQFESLPSDIGAQLSSGNVGLTNALNALTTQLTKLDSIVALLSSSSTDLGVANTYGRSVKNNAQQIQTDASDALARATSVNGTVSTITTGGSDQLTSITKDTILNDLSRLVALLTGMVTGAATAVADQINQTTNVNVAKSKIDDQIGTTSTAFLIGQVRANRTTAVGAIGSSTAPQTGVFLALSNIDALVGASASNAAVASNRLNLVEVSLDAIYDHVDRFLAADCKANLVTVPILARDAGGFYAAPSASLIQSLQTYFDARKEVTQTVQVVSGANFLVQPKIVVRVAVKSGFSLSVTEAAARAAIDSILRGRRFGESLYVSEINDAITALSGIGFVNITIAGHKVTTPVTTFIDASKLDAEGNLIIRTSEIITKDTTDATMIVVNTEAYQTS